MLAGWRSSTIDAHLYSDEDEVFHDIQAIKERLQLNIEFARPEDFVPPLEGAEGWFLSLRPILAAPVEGGPRVPS